MEGIYFLFLLYITASLAVDNEEEQIRVKRQYNQNLFTQYQSNRRDANWDPRSEEGA